MPLLNNNTTPTPLHSRSPWRPSTAADMMRTMPCTCHSLHSPQCIPVCDVNNGGVVTGMTHIQKTHPTNMRTRASCAPISRPRIASGLLPYRNFEAPIPKGKEKRQVAPRGGGAPHHHPQMVLTTHPGGVGKILQLELERWDMSAFSAIHRQCAGPSSRSPAATPQSMNLPITRPGAHAPMRVWQLPRA